MAYLNLAKASHVLEGRNCEARTLSIDCNNLLLGWEHDT